MRTVTGIAFGLLMLMLPPLAAAQTNLGELLDAGAKKASSQELKRDIVGHAFAGPLPTIGNIEIAYLPDGTIQGQSPEPAAPTVSYPPSRVTGEWTIDDTQRLCSTVRIQAYGGQWAAGRGVLPTSCQFWFKLGDVYFVSNSDKDRSARVIKRTPLAMPVAAVAASTPRPPPAPVAELSTLGELLDAGAKRLSAEEFRRDVVQRALVGPSPTGGALEIMYAPGGSIQGVGTPPGGPLLSLNAAISGEWTIDDSERICSTIRVSPPGGGGGPRLLPKRCEYWLKLGGAYFVSDSDKDRGARVLKRTLQPSPVAPLAEPRNLGELLDAGARKVSSQEFKRDVVQRTIVGPTTAGGEIEVMYVANGTIQGRRSTQMVGSQPYPNPAPVAGEWEVDQTERVCDAMRITPTYGATMSLPARCQFWFKLGDTYFISDSDSDRRASVLRRILQR